MLSFPRSGPSERLLVGSTARSHDAAVSIALLPISWAYGLAIYARNAYYIHAPAAVQRVAIPVISVGNLTVGGTGKTPLVIEIVRRLLARGHQPAILTRGYGAKAGAVADEVLEFHESLPQTPVVVRPDRVAGAGVAMLKHRADCVVLDDGFQHRRLARDLDLVLVDALNPWGGGARDVRRSGSISPAAPLAEAVEIETIDRSPALLLPAGRLREPLGALCRASAVVLTRVNQAPPARVAALLARIRRIAPALPILQSEIRIEGLSATDDADLTIQDAADAGLLTLCGIGNPGTFHTLVESCVATPLAQMNFPDHHRYGVADADRIVSVAKEAGCDLVLTTRKDWVKLAPLWPQVARGLPLARLDIRAVLLDDGGAFEGLLSRALERKAGPTTGAL